MFLSVLVYLTILGVDEGDYWGMKFSQLRESQINEYNEYREKVLKLWEWSQYFKCGNKTKHIKVGRNCKTNIPFSHFKLARTRIGKRRNRYGPLSSPLLARTWMVLLKYEAYIKRVMQACNPSSLRMKEGGAKVQSQLQPLRETLGRQGEKRQRKMAWACFANVITWIWCFEAKDNHWR